MQGSWFWMLLAVVVMLLGLYVLVRGLRQKNDTLEHGDTKFKNGLPITPRDERKFTDEPESDALSDMAKVMQATPVSALSQERDEPKTEYAPAQAIQTRAEQISINDVDNGFDESAPAIERHLDEQEAYDEANNPLENCEETVTIIITPQYGATILGRKVLEISRNYGLRHGVMNMFHRHEMEDGRGDLWFSMMAEDSNGLTAFDLNTMADAQYNSLVLFLTIPHNQLLRGYDSMVSTANMLARELDAILTDENRMQLDDESLDRLRGILSTH
ncbi:cell division protein ZipA C-terminal FtsZ-binding domain-containing protein [uncultured Moraxella sp.]|uniref:cell division protein ZipA C-terminal FtsZ-binding domain-containing protein n=1 Tax=uncultured Moraxella sp. TaxID=263769 RepID=UPI0025F037FB|nr:cell division protein ZipA C-terminal FtsZ-binding domain-containing protein [uncultured Moraxella sp.]